MASETIITLEIIAKAESMREGVCAGIARLTDVLQAPSYKAAHDLLGRHTLFGQDGQVEWPADAATVLVLGLRHPADEPRRDWWERGDTLGNRFLRRISQSMKRWLFKTYGLDALPLPYHIEKGGLFLKDAAVLAGLGIIGRNNLVLHPQWGPRVRWRSLLIRDALPPTQPVQDFAPCDTCAGFCHLACPISAFEQGRYNRFSCARQMQKDEARRDADGRFDFHGRFHPVIKYCRACELACPVGA